MGLAAIAISLIYYGYKRGPTPISRPYVITNDQQPKLALILSVFIIGYVSFCRDKFTFFSTEARDRYSPALASPAVGHVPPRFPIIFSS